MLSTFDFLKNENNSYEAVISARAMFAPVLSLRLYCSLNPNLHLTVELNKENAVKTDPI